MTSLQIRTTAGGVRLSVRVQPRASSNGIVGVQGNALKVRLTAPPVDGAANEALVKFIAGTFAVPARDVTIVAGSSSRSKVVEIVGITEKRVRSLLQR